MTILYYLPLIHGIGDKASVCGLSVKDDHPP